MAVTFGSILALNNSGSEATLDANNLKGTSHVIDNFNSECLATIGEGLLLAPGKRALGTIISTTGSFGVSPSHYIYNQTSSGDFNFSGSEWTTTDNWGKLALASEITGSFTSLSSSIASDISAIPNIDTSSLSGGLLPTTNITYDIGSPTKKWNNLYALNTYFGGIHEINLGHEGLNKIQEGTVLVLQNGILQPCEKADDPLIMAVAASGSNYPIVLGAEPVLVTGVVREGDYIITSNIKGHGKAVSPHYIYSKQLFGKIIAQAIESGKGKSHLIKAMIRKM